MAGPLPRTEESHSTRGGCVGRWWCDDLPGTYVPVAGAFGLVPRTAAIAVVASKDDPPRLFGPIGRPTGLGSRSQHWYRVRDLHLRRPQAEGSPILRGSDGTRAVPDALQEPGHRFRRFRKRLRLKTPSRVKRGGVNKTNSRGASGGAAAPGPLFGPRDFGCEFINHRLALGSKGEPQTSASIGPCCVAH